MDKLYSKTWGFVNTPSHTKWTKSEILRGGVAMLLNPYSSITTMDLWQEDHWTSYRMAVQIYLKGDTILVVNVYALSEKNERKKFFEMLRHQL
ncbi:hypothetical protein CCR75_000414 [Bremia lactucae]|uniref:Uncharacterized protein n=1 Tax=Bremia lactucae TaxID=4779 RepID=A0A976ICB0_BRELC|nr:hypothetical protein CCR75_000414 [Bremia lactucae]